jgi:amidase
VGFFARSADVFQAVGQVLLGDDTTPGTPARLLVATDAFATADDAVSEALARVMPRLRARFSPCEDVTLATEGLSVWRERQRRLQQIEFGSTFRDWIDQTNPRFSFEVGRSLALASLLTEADVASDRSFRQEVTARIEGLLDGASVLCLPTVPILPPLRDISLSAMAEAGGRLVTLTCIAGLTGLPQINLPLAETPDGIPVGLSLIGWRGSDSALLRLAAALASD